MSRVLTFTSGGVVLGYNPFGLLCLRYTTGSLMSPCLLPLKFPSFPSLPGSVILQKWNLLQHFFSAASQVIPAHWKSTTTPPHLQWVSTVNALVRLDLFSSSLMLWDPWFLFLFPPPVHLTLDHLWLGDGNSDTYAYLFIYLFLYTLLEWHLRVCPSLLAPFSCSFPSLFNSLSSLRPTSLPFFSLFIPIIQHVR